MNEKRTTAAARSKGCEQDAWQFSGNQHGPMVWQNRLLISIAGR